MGWENNLSPKDFEESEQRDNTKRLQKMALANLVSHPELREELLTLLDTETDFEDQAKFATDEDKKGAVIKELEKIRRRIDEILNADLERKENEQIKEALRKDAEELKRRIWDDLNNL